MDIEWLELSALVAEKETLPVGSWFHPAQGFGFEIDKPFLEHVAANFSAMKTNGVKVPLQSTHEGDGNCKGWLNDVAVKPNKDGIESLFLTVAFDDEQAKIEAFRHDTSVGIRNQVVDGKGNVYHKALQHVALTNYPVIPGLSNWKLLAASRNFAGAVIPKGKQNMDLETLAQLLGIAFDSSMDEAAQLAMVKSKIAMLIGANPAQQQMPPNPAAELGQSAPQQNMPPQQHKKQCSCGANLSIAVDAIKASRTAQLESLVLSGYLTPAESAELAKQVCTDDSCELLLSGSGTQDELAKYMAIRKTAGKAWTKTGRTAISESDAELQLSMMGETDSPLIAARKRS